MIIQYEQVHLIITGRILSPYIGLANCLDYPYFKLLKLFEVTVEYG